MPLSLAPASHLATSDELHAGLAALPGWELHEGALRRTFAFPDYRATIAFVNAVADLANAQDHHPDMLVGYDRCEVRWSSHNVGGISQNDFTSAQRVERLPR